MTQRDYLPVLALRHRPSSQHSRTSLVYRAYDAAGELVYIGATWEWIIRQNHHRYTTQWWQREVACVELTSYPDRRAALDAEKVAIQMEHPKRNRQHNRKTLAT